MATSLTEAPSRSSVYSRYLASSCSIQITFICQEVRWWFICFRWFSKWIISLCPLHLYHCLHFLIHLSSDTRFHVHPFLWLLSSFTSLTPTLISIYILWSQFPPLPNILSIYTLSHYPFSHLHPFLWLLSTFTQIPLPVLFVCVSYVFVRLHTSLVVLQETTKVSQWIRCTALRVKSSQSILSDAVSATMYVLIINIRFIGHVATKRNYNVSKQPGLDSNPNISASHWLTLCTLHRDNYCCSYMININQWSK